uniref:WGS project CBMG000000000 data, contig CS5907-c003360 n=1 Tax=Fusarium acuminatum CS5907 TaxID=1318461 RepID=A0A090N554_9HYPO|nr:unnamed protein product [Fusarium acuminatum CS5907]
MEVSYDLSGVSYIGSRDLGRVGISCLLYGILQPRAASAAVSILSGIYNVFHLLFLYSFGFNGGWRFWVLAWQWVYSGRSEEVRVEHWVYLYTGGQVQPIGIR